MDGSARGGPQANAVSVGYHFSMAMTLRLTSEQDRMLEDLAREDGVSKQEAVVRASELIAEQRSHRGAVADAATWALDRYKELLERLGE